MSLQVWLPLTKDLRQQGVASTPAITLASGNELISGGKLGDKALKLTHLQTILETSSCMSGKKQMSYAFWVKVNTAWSANWLDGIRYITTNGTSTHTSRQEFYTNCTRVGTWFQGGSISEKVFTPGVWTHLAASFDYETGKAAFYINGILQGTSTALDTTHYCRGDFYIGDGGVDIVENDVRIYDHCLSPMEVKELSKGLVLHYPLNRQGWGQENLAKNTSLTDLTSSNLSSKLYYASSNPPTITQDGIKFTWSNSTAREVNVYLDKTLEANTDYTLSFIYRNNMDISGTYFYLRDSVKTLVGFWSQPTIPYSENWATYTCTFKIVNYQDKNATTGTILSLFYSGYTANKWIEIKQNSIKLEEGSIATPWSPASSDELADTMGFNGTTEYDTSGFNNNGMKTGTFSWTSNCPKYEVSTYFGGNSYILTDSGSFAWFDFNQCTIAAWFNPTLKPSGYSGSIGIAHNQNASHKYFAISNYGGVFVANSINGSSYINTSSNYTLPLNEWHHCVATLDGTTVKVYVDGELKNTATISWGNSGIATDTRVNVGTDLPGTDEMYTGYYSDVRIYATALSADDVKSLYQNSAYIDSNGNVYGAVHSEV